MAAGDLSNHAIETYKSMITFTTEVLKLLALMNGGASVAVLTFAGHLAVSRGGGEWTAGVRLGLYRYCGGLVATALAFMLAYVTQLQLYGESVLGTPEKHLMGVAAACVLALIAVVAFAFGCIVAAEALSTIPPGGAAPKAA
jgi:hypothetical protein